MKQLLSALILCISFFAAIAQEQTEKGIRFTSEANWQAVLSKAKQENKMIFLDCYTTWCAPCKVMDEQIYPSEKVGAFFNEHFIAVKIQMDKTNKDNEHIRSWYADAKKIEKDLGINAYPSLLFLSPEGKPLHRAAGLYPEDKLIQLGKDAMNPERQSYVLAEKYDVKKMDTAELRDAALKFYRSNPDFANNLATAYFKKVSDAEIVQMVLNDDKMIDFFSIDERVVAVMNGYLNAMNEKQLLTKQNIKLMARFSRNSSKDRGFKMFYKYPARIDSIMVQEEFKYDWATPAIDNVIYEEEVQKAVDLAKEKKTTPDWAKITNAITKKYGADYAFRAVTTGKRNLAANRKDYKELTKQITNYMEKYGKGHMLVWSLNQEIWNVFQYSNNKDELSKALSWAVKVITVFPDPNYLDTYANLLYKLGKPKTAIIWEEMAAKLAPDNADIKEVLEKMKAGIPTWPEVKK